MTAFPQPTQQAIAILVQAQAALGEINGNGYGTAGIIPADVAIPTPVTKSVPVGTTGAWHQPVFQDRSFILYPRAQYQQWQSAWALLMGFTGWWGPKAEWPLGDGARAEADAGTAAHLPPAVAGLTTIQTTLTVVQAPSWIPNVQWSAIGALGVFVIGGVLAWFNARNVLEGDWHHLVPRQKRAALWGWNLGRAAFHMMRDRR